MFGGNLAGNIKLSPMVIYLGLTGCKNLSEGRLIGNLATRLRWSIFTEESMDG
jgi:hypothetical protein